MMQDNDKIAAEKFLKAKSEQYLWDNSWSETSDGWKRNGTKHRRIPLEDAVKMQQLVDKWGARVAAAR